MHLIDMFAAASTFKVELDECSRILREAGPRSFVVLDGGHSPFFPRTEILTRCRAWPRNIDVRRYGYRWGCSAPPRHTLTPIGLLRCEHPCSSVSQSRRVWAHDCSQTHYGSLTDDYTYHPNIRKMHMMTNVDDEQRQVVFLYKLIPGVAESSHGTRESTDAHLLGLADA